MSKSNRSSEDALDMIRKGGLRATAARVSVLNVLLSADHALSHSEIEHAVEKTHDMIERVTLYRVLDWLVNNTFAHKVVGADRVWRFNATLTTDHAHFNCTHCGQIYCLENLTPAVALTLPEGFKLQHADVAVQGLCPRCSH